MNLEEIFKDKSESTKKNYIQRINRLKKLYFPDDNDYIFIKKPNRLIKKINGSEYPASTKRDYYIALYAVDANEKYKNEMYKFRDETNTKQGESKISEEKIKNYDTMKNLRKILDMMPEDTYTQVRDKLLISIYLLKPPIRNDLEGVSIFKKDLLHFHSNIKDSLNYIQKKDKEFIFYLNQYKTVKKYGPKKIIYSKSEDPEIYNLFKKIMKFNKPFLIVNDTNNNNLDDKQISSLIIKIFENYLNKHVSINTIRHIYETELINSEEYKKMSMTQKKAKHDELMHDFTTAHTDYNKINMPKEKPEQEEKNNKYYYVLTNNKISKILGSDNSETKAKEETLKNLSSIMDKVKGKYIYLVTINTISDKDLEAQINDPLKLLGGKYEILIEKVMVIDEKTLRNDGGFGNNKVYFNNNNKNDELIRKAVFLFHNEKLKYSHFDLNFFNEKLENVYPPLYKKSEEKPNIPTIKYDVNEIIKKINKEKPIEDKKIPLKIKYINFDDLTLPELKQLAIDYNNKFIIKITKSENEKQVLKNKAELLKDIKYFLKVDDNNKIVSQCLDLELNLVVNEMKGINGQIKNIKKLIETLEKNLVLKPDDKERQELLNQQKEQLAILENKVEEKPTKKEKVIKEKIEKVKKPKEPKVDKSQNIEIKKEIKEIIKFIKNNEKKINASTESQIININKTYYDAIDNLKKQLV